MSLKALLAQLEREPALDALATANTPAKIFLSRAFAPFVLAGLSESVAAGRPALIVTPDERVALELAHDMQTFLGDRPVRHYPARGLVYESHIAPSPHLVGMRIAALDSLTDSGGQPPVVVASVAALAEKVPDPELRPHGFRIEKGELIDFDELSDKLIDLGYERVDRVQDRGQFAIRGDLLDVYSPTEERAGRIELFDVEVESIREFSTFTQRSLGEANSIELAPAAELAREHREPALAAVGAAGEGDARPDIADLLPVDRFSEFFDLLGEDVWIAAVGSEEFEPALADVWSDIEAAFHDTEVHDLYVEPANLLAKLHQRASLDASHHSGAQEIQIRAERAHGAARSLDNAEAELEKLTRSGYRTVITWARQGEADRARYNMARVRPMELPEPGGEFGAGVYFTAASLREGFIAPSIKLAVIPEHRLLHRRRKQEQTPGRRGRIMSFADLGVGDIVVHEDHGIARFTGFDTKTVAEVTRDYLSLDYKGGDKVFLPAEQLHKISRYFGAGAGGTDIALSKLGGKSWETLKTRARKAAHELAGELINLYAERKRRAGHAFPLDSEWQLQFEEAFPYRETPDQMDAIEAVKADMEEALPMDRLICGDVGYGKTEVALRAAFKAAQDGKQVMVLAPTTILAQQHFGTFSERLRDFPIRVDQVSRFRKPAEVKQILNDFADGKVDILIGTSRLLSRDVNPSDLGLLIIDEEQRFGVKQKELMRQLRLRVDVIAMSATPIPRTLQMSLAGLRDISVIETPPEGRRPVKTYVGEYDEELVKQALQREKSRGGQALFLHDRVETIDEAAERVRAICPEMDFEVVHGQLDETVLEERMLAFIRGDHDCLVCTTIVEAGLDIPSANTLVVERSDRLGLAQAYQIRGRVGRGGERAYAYFMYPSAAALTQTAAERLSTLSDHTELGSGFKIAMRDLEIRGAGNLLGDEQSGHIAAIGFDLYVSMIETAVAELSGETADEGPEPVRLDVSVDAYVPSDYVTYEQAKIELHRRIAGAREIADLILLREELEDRFGPVPDPVDHLLRLQDARIKFGRAGVKSVTFKSDRIAVAPVILDSTGLRGVREDLPTAVYDSTSRTLTLRVGQESALRFDLVVGLSEALLKQSTHIDH